MASPTRGMRSQIASVFFSNSHKFGFTFQSALLQDNPFFDAIFLVSVVALIKQESYGKLKFHRAKYCSRLHGRW